MNVVRVDVTYESARDVIENETMSLGQWLVVFICAGLLALDGYDVLSIAFAAPGLSAEWEISKPVLGLVLPLELVGMAIGSVLLGRWADTRGRRPTLISALVIMTVGMAFAGAAPDIFTLAAARVFTGVGIGGLLSAANAGASDVCNKQNRGMALTLIAGGFAFGIFAGATIVSPLLKQYDWRITFFLGAMLSGTFLPVVYWFVPESISFLERTRPAGASTEIGRILERFGHEFDQFEARRGETVHTPVQPTNLFVGDLARTTAILCFAYFGTVLTYYYFVKWLPIVVTDLGFTVSEATDVLASTSLGGVCGAVAIGGVARFAPVRHLLVVILFAASAGVACFPLFMTSLLSMKLVGFITGCTLLAATAGFYGLFATSYPSSLLGMGSGIVLAVGRGGAILGPVIPGFLFGAGFSYQSVALAMSTGSLLAGSSVIYLRKSID